MYYFAYGSNMSSQRLRQRVPSARVVTVASLRGHRLAFHKSGRDGSAKCDAAPSPHAGDLVFGVVYVIDRAHKAQLDTAEGLGKGYDERTVTLDCAGSTTMTAFTYCATLVDPDLKPFDWYHEHVLRGAREHGLPAAYVAAIAAVESIEDPNSQRQCRERAIYT
ncbi:MAG TPA: gamma-glutamylcyclotransferase [Gammaproteobacteria bacterium]|nr:gamma-glutamylcyclotransferase [Gammaproteobacteria bacterium]